MPTLKQLINRHLYTVTFFLVFFNLMIASLTLVKITHDRTNEEALRSLAQIEQIMLETQKEPNTTEQTLIQHSYIFSLFRVNPYVFYYAIDSRTGKITGSSLSEEVNMDCSKIGFYLEDMEKSENSFHANINGKDSHCVFRKIDSYYIIYVINLRYLYHELPAVICILSICMALIAFVLAASLNEYIKRNIVEKLQKMNNSLTSITNGDLNQMVDVTNIYELSELSTHINTMVQSLFSSNTKLTYVLSKTNFYLGTYEYLSNGKKVQFSEYIPKLFSLDDETSQKLSSDPEAFKCFINNLRKHNTSDEPNIYELADKYLKIDEITEKDYILGVVMDVTNTVQKHKKLELEVYTDPITGLYNRKGLEIKLAELFSTPEILGHYAIIMLMADNLTNINTTYGSDSGDIYLKKLADIITDFGIRSSIAARQWGGEFILFLYGYSNETELSKAINLLTYIQDHSFAHIADTIDVPLGFSFVYYTSSDSECTDYHILLKHLK